MRTTQIITVTGYVGCKRISTTYIGYEEGFVRFITEWAAQNNVCEWSRDTMPPK